MSTVRLRLLGKPAVEPAPVPDAPLSCKCMALLAFLALEPGQHSREELAALLWGETDDAHARASLRQALMKLRACLGEHLETTRQWVSLDSGVEVDVREFLETSATDPHRVLDHEVETFLEDLHPQAAPAFDHWADEKREYLLARQEAALARATRDLFKRSLWEGAIELGGRWLQRRPLSEDAVRLLMEALALAGRPTEALEVYRDYRAHLQSELGAEPPQHVTELADRIAPDVKLSSRRRSSGARRSEPRFDAALTGREEEWAALSRAWKDVAGGRGRVVVIEGEEGVGKSRLAREFLSWVSLEGGVVLSGQAYAPAPAAPYGPIAEALSDLLDAPGLGGASPEWLAELARLAPRVRQRFPGVPDPDAGSPVDRTRLFEGVAQSILTVAQDRSVALFIDELEWCDEESAALIHFLARRSQDARVLLLATLTGGDLRRDQDAAGLLRSLRAEGLALAIPLDPLSVEDVHSIIRGLGNLTAPGAGERFAQRVYQVTDGNPFHVIELLKTLFAQGVLQVDLLTGEWVASEEHHEEGYASLQMPSTVRDAISARVDRLPYELRDLLATVSVSGEGVTPELLSRVHGISRLRAAALADALVERQFLSEQSGVYSTAHPLTGRVITQLLTDARRRELHRALAVTLIELAEEGEPGLASDIAWHASKARDAKTAVRYALQAAAEAMDRLALEEARTMLSIAEQMDLDGHAEEIDALRESIQRAGDDESPTARSSSSGPRLRSSDIDLRRTRPAQRRS